MSAEGESVGLHAGIEEFDFEGAIRDRAVLPDQLIEPLPIDGALAVGIGVGAMVGAGRGAVERHAEPDRFAVRGRAEHKMQIAGMKADRRCGRPADRAPRARRRRSNGPTRLH